uniref:Uncharacterized protein n=1 Tax=Anguilla anguilla TaxID=7936 RepID=A0A0E9WBH8_ANGAN
MPTLRNCNPDIKKPYWKCNFCRPSSLKSCKRRFSSCSFSSAAKIHIKSKSFGATYVTLVTKNRRTIMKRSFRINPYPQPTYTAPPNQHKMPSA